MPADLSLNLLRNRKFQLQVFVLLVFTIFISCLAFFWGKVSFIDDAYITFRYARNLADGFGIRWNVHDAPTQGSTTFGFLILIALGLKIGISPEIAAFLLNTLGNLFIAFSAMFFYRIIFRDDSFFGILVSATQLMFAGLLALTSSGMESVFATGIVYLTLLFLLIFMRSFRPVYASIVVILSFAICLIRPENFLIVALWFLYLLWKTKAPTRKLLVIYITCFGLGGITYLLCLNSYFGYVLPNSFYLKVGAGLNRDGIAYVFQAISVVLGLPITVIGLVGLILLSYNKFYVPLAFFAPYILLPFYLFTNPLMGNYLRFLLTPISLSFFLIAGASVFHARLILTEVSMAKSIWIIRFQPFIKAIVLVGVSLLFIASFYIQGYYFLQNRLEYVNPIEYLDNPYPKTWRIALRLAEINDIENVRIMYGDAGVIAYETRAYYIDPVGLNDTEIAINAQSLGASWLIDFLLSKNPDLIAFYTDHDGYISNTGHGVIGTSYSDLYLHPQFTANYMEISAVDHGEIIVRWFVNIHSQYIVQLEDAIKPFSMENPPEIIP